MRTSYAVRTAVTAVTLLVLGAGVLRAQRTTDTTLNVRGAARLNVTNQNGTITVRSWNRNQIHIVAESDHDRDRGRIEVTESASGVSVRSSSRYGGRGDVDFTITVPAKTALELHGMSSDIEIVNVCGEVDINTMNGDISIDCAEGNVQIQTISGDISLGNVRGPVDISTTSGEIDLRNIRGQIAAQSVSGDISLAQIESNDITAEVVSGDVSYEGRLVDGGRYKFAAHSGDVTLTVPGTPNAAISIETFNGEFESDFQITIGGGERNRMGKNMEFRLGTGSARVQLSSFSGTISLRRQGASNREE